VSLLGGFLRIHAHSAMVGVPHRLPPPSLPTGFGLQASVFSARGSCIDLRGKGIRLTLGADWQHRFGVWGVELQDSGIILKLSAVSFVLRHFPLSTFASVDSALHSGRPPQGQETEILKSEMPNSGTRGGQRSCALSLGVQKGRGTEIPKFEKPNSGTSGGQRSCALSLGVEGRRAGRSLWKGEELRR